MRCNMMKKLSLVFVIVSFLLISFAISTEAVGTGDGKLLRRSPEETCHACHKTDQNAPGDNNSLKIHNSTNTASSKWGAGWGITGGQYGKFGCTTCHTAHNTANIYLIKDNITTADNSTWQSKGTAGLPVDFRTKGGSSGVTPGLLGDDNTSAHTTTSTRVCEVCHSKTKYHNYDAQTKNTGGTTHNNASNCTATCHLHSTGFKPDLSLSCGQCHGGPPTDNNSTITSNVAKVPAGATGRNAQWATPAGAHSVHNAASITCDGCHAGGMQLSDGTDKNSKFNIGFNMNSVSKSGAYNAPVFTNGNYTFEAWNTNGGSTTITNVGSARTCSSIYCHSNIQNATGTAGATAWSTPNWDVPSTGQCGTCHPGDGVSGNATLIASGSHTKHVSTQGIVCTACHSGAGSGMSAHYNGVIDVTMWPTFGGTYNGSNASPGNHAPGQGFGTCSTNYCHSNAVASPTYSSPVWGSSGTAACGTCHGADNTTVPASSAHAKHVGTAANYKFSCSKCHSSVVSATADSTTKPTITTPSLHVNKATNVAFDSFNPIGTISGSSCSQVYCHSNTKGQYAAVSWSAGTLACNACHGIENSNAKGYPAYASGAAGSSTANSHVRHADNVTGSNINCAVCHNATTLNGTSIKSGSTTHVDNNTQNVVFDTTQSTGWYSTGGKYCGSTACHGAGTPRWGGASLLCNECHLANSSLQGKHSTHYASATIADNKTAVNASTSSAYRFNCGVCHYSGGTTHAGGWVTTNQAAEVAFDPTVAGGGTYTPDPAVLAGTDNGSFKWTAGASSNACSNTYCHSSGRGAAPLVTNMRWNTSAAFDCASCHGGHTGNGTQIASGSHTIHVVSNNFDCGYCHQATSTNGTAITDKSKHVNKTVDVAFWGSVNPSGNATYNGSSTPLAKTPSTAFGSCANITCHGQGTTLTWGSTIASATCVKCHGVSGTDNATYAADNKTAAPGYSTVGRNTAGSAGTITNNVSNDAKVGAHDKHLRAYSVWGTIGYSNNVDCSNCHTQYTAVNTSGHMNGSTDFTWSSLARNSGTDYTASTGVLTPSYAGGTCSVNYCHGGGFWTSSKGTGISLGWTSNAYLSNPPQTDNSADCNRCHVSPPTTKTRAAGAAHPAATLSPANCSTCHGHNGWGTSHIDGKLQATGGSCNGCHWYDTTDAGAWTTNVGIGGGSGLWMSTNAWGAHVKHINHIKTRWGSVLNKDTDTFGGTAFNNVCGLCHTQTEGNHQNTTRQVDFNNSATHQFGASLPSWNTVTRSCSNLDCHFKASPVW